MSVNSVLALTTTRSVYFTDLSLAELERAIAKSRLVYVWDDNDERFLLSSRQIVTVRRCES